MIGDEDTPYEFLEYGVQQRTRWMGVRLPVKWVFSTYWDFSWFGFAFCFLRGVLMGVWVAVVGD